MESGRCGIEMKMKDGGHGFLLVFAVWVVIIKQNLDSVHNCNRRGQVSRRKALVEEDMKLGVGTEEAD